MKSQQALFLITRNLKKALFSFLIAELVVQLIQLETDIGCRAYSWIWLEFPWWDFAIMAETKPFPIDFGLESLLKTVIPWTNRPKNTWPGDSNLQVNPMHLAAMKLGSKMLMAPAVGTWVLASPTAFQPRGPSDCQVPGDDSQSILGGNKNPCHSQSEATE